MIASDRHRLPAQTSLTVAADAAELAGIRRHVGGFVRGLDADDEVVAEFELVVSELATNVIMHTDASEVTVSVARDEHGWTLDVSDADELVLDGPRSLPDPSTPTGRGLFVVQELMDTVTVVESDRGRSIRCTRAAA
jgi:serine/threonine-protein kinase RsbW